VATVNILDSAFVTTEVELKLSIDAADIPRLKKHPLIKALQTAKPRTRRLLSIYYDTPQLTLHNQGFTLRVRRMSGRWFQAVKGGGSAANGLHQRYEWEDKISRGEPDFNKLVNITHPELVILFASETLRNSLKPLFSTDTKRSEWQLTCADGSHVELALDVGHLLIDGKQHEAICEVELELKSGHVANLFELAAKLQADIALQAENTSKAQRGYDYITRVVDN
jgi:triphosphatase